MSDDGIAALIRVAERVAGGEPLTIELMGDEGVPVALRLVIASVALTAADLPVSKTSITSIAPATRSATYRDHAELLEAAKVALPPLVAAQLQLAGSKPTAADLAAKLEDANKTIARERALRVELQAQVEQVASYARELHWKLKPEYEAVLRERQEKVTPLRVVSEPPDAPDPDET